MNRKPLDPYCFPGTNVLRNLPGLLDRKALELYAIHPFREGNSRTLRLFFHGVAHNAGYLADWRILTAPEQARDTLYRARDRAVMHGDSAPLAALFSTVLSPL